MLIYVKQNRNYKKLKYVFEMFKNCFRLIIVLICMLKNVQILNQFQPITDGDGIVEQ